MEKRLNYLYLQQQYTNRMILIGFIIIAGLQIMFLINKPTYDIQLKSLEQDNLPPIEQLNFDY